MSISGETSLMKAAEMGYTKSVRILLEHGADVNSKDESGELYTIIVTISIYPPIYISVNIRAGSYRN